MEKLAAADAAARKLGSVDPTIRVDVDDNGAVTKLAAVDAAAKKLDGSSRSLDSSLRNVNNTNAGGVQKWQLMAAAIVAVLPLIAPLAGYALGVAGAFAGMGAAGALAIYGIIKATKDATVTGEAYKSGLASLKTALDSLGSTAADAMLGSFKQAVAQINAALPILNSQINTFGRILGNVGNSVLSSAISALRILNPLFVEASAYVLKLAQSFQSWAQGGGLQKFTDYARTQLPLVANMLGQLAAAALHIVDALAPLGTVVVQGITLLGAAINAIPLPLLLDVAAAAAAGFAAFKLWGLIQPILSTVATSIGAVGVATQLAEGPIGWVTAGISALAAVLAVSVTAQQQATQGAIDFANALQLDNDKIAENVRLTAVKKLHDDGAIAAGHLLGYTTQQMTAAATGNAAAMSDLNSKMAETEKRLASTGAATGEGTKKQNDQYRALKTLKQGFSEVGAELAQGKTREQEIKDATAGANTTLATNADLLTALKDASDKAATATDKLSKQLSGMGQVNLSASQANIAYEQSIADAASTAKQYGQSLDLTTDAGRRNMSALDSIASSAVALISAQAKAGTSTDVLTQNMGAARQSFITAAEAAGATAAQANQLADQYGLIPKNVTTAIATSGVPQAEADVARINAALASINRLITVRVQTIMTNATNPNTTFGLGNGGINVTGKREGGTITAAGGLTVPGGGSSSVDSVPALLAPGEEVVSNMNGQASFWRSALKMMNSGNRLGVAREVARLTGAPTSQPNVTNKSQKNVYHINGFGSEDVARQIEFRNWASWNVA